MVKIFMTIRFVMNCTVGDGREIDHINQNGHDCRRSNLQDITHQENIQRRRMQRNNTSGYVGVRPYGSNWVASVTQYKKRYWQTFIRNPSTNSS